MKGTEMLRQATTAEIEDCRRYRESDEYRRNSAILSAASRRAIAKDLARFEIVEDEPERFSWSDLGALGLA
jgi:hypothetical protein